MVIGRKEQADWEKPKLKNWKTKKWNNPHKAELGFVQKKRTKLVTIKRHRTDEVKQRRENRRLGVKPT